MIKIKNKRINKNKKELRDYYQENKVYGVEGIRNIFDDDDDDDDDDEDDDVFDGVRQLFLVKTKKESLNQIYLKINFMV